MAVAILVLITSCAAVAAGWSYVRIARRMRSFATTRETVTGRAVMPVPAGDGRGVGGAAAAVTDRW